MQESTKQEVRFTKKEKKQRMLRGTALKIEGFEGLFKFIEQRGEIVSCLTPSGTLAGFHINRVRPL